MKRYISLTAIIFALSSILIACSSDNNSVNENSTNANFTDSNEQEKQTEENVEVFEEDERNLEDIVEHFEDEGINIINTESRVYQSDATEAMEVFLDGGTVILHKHPVDSDELKEIKDNGYIDQGEGFPNTNAVHNSLFVMTGFDEARPSEEGLSDEEQEEIIDVFESF